MPNYRLFLPGLLLLMMACNSKKEIVDIAPPPAPLAEKPAFHIVEDYRASRPLDMKMEHTQLYLKPNFSTARMHGTAYLTLKPHFYPATEVLLDAKGFDIKRVEEVGDDFFRPLHYSYDGLVLKVFFNQVLSGGTPITLLIEYVAKPNELKNVKGSAAIQGAKGLYFINHDGRDSLKPVQLWTQGETESNSCWYPTIDAPNQKTSQEIYLTVDTAFVSLSNGELVYSTDNGDGTRTDYWKQELKHAPYLTMLAVGKFAVVKDSWRDKEVSYYVEPEFEPYAREIYTRTPDMLEFYSELLGFPYPWDKYAQVAVRDYVSGAMENTGAVIFGEWAQRTHREMLDGSAEGTVAHELFHHWFGDLVTCESWSNLSINESFATYGTYLWYEHAYGKMVADQSLYGNLQSYLFESRRKQVDLVRFYYDDKEQMFDSHSYAKGSRILHMLRQEVGDKAFFAALKLFLHRHAYQAVEIQQLRLAFEEVTGRDLNWFFNQWFYASGHPILDFQYGYDAESGEVLLNIRQEKSNPNAPLYRLPMLVDIYTSDSKITQSIVLSRDSQEFRFKSEKPVLVNADADKMLLCEKRENKSAEDYVQQFRRAPNYVDHLEALLYLRNQPGHAGARSVFMDAMQHEVEAMRSMAIQQFQFDGWKADAALAAALLKLVNEDASSSVRAGALTKLMQMDSSYNAYLCIQRAERDSSFRVIGTAINQLVQVAPDDALCYAGENEEHRNMRAAIAELYAKAGNKEHAVFFETYLPLSSGWSQAVLFQRYAEMAIRLDDKMLIQQASRFMRSMQAANLSPMVARVAAQEAGKLETILLPSIDK
ncbi:MAG: M1 family metallopeptidase [Bacteroidia bacterium]